MFSKLRDSYSFFSLFYNIYYTDFEDEITNIKKEVNEFAERFEFIEEE